MVQHACLLPQNGLTVVTSMMEASGLLPVTLQPGATLVLATVLCHSPVSGEGEVGEGQEEALASAQRDVNLLEVEYELLHTSPPTCAPSVVPALGEATAPAARTLPLAMCPPPPHPEWLGQDAATHASKPGAEPGTGGRSYLFRHLLSLEMYPGEASPSKLVYIRLLGPFTAQLGQPLTLTWRLERAPEYQGPPTTSSEVVMYEVSAQGGGWRPSGKRSGSVSLATVGGAAATVEASWVPVAEGALQVPELRLRNFPHQELFDVGQATDDIMVLPPMQDISLSE